MSLHEDDQALGRIEQKIDSLVERLFNGVGVIPTILADQEKTKCDVKELRDNDKSQSGFIRGVAWVGGAIISILSLILTAHLLGGK